ncbi:MULTISPECIES: hypothetical protein [Staphylococcus]|uniref:hypothetical protein n=1 Tax=Staphylococcus TaxID=1279 RepID=UPI0008A92E88|nr:MULTISPECIES: hypothetical protein [Staphylococcus]MDS3864711.1 hypothetical protein [Staphylococcus hominis]OHO49041.1 hypothetical protein HMPREF2647_06335 [Staphylococcus sp. HMSC035D11]SEL91990.1 hypothetical protein SAMN03159421_00041 [Staphylococcus hominis]
MSKGKKRFINPVMHFYFPEADQQGNKVKIDERFYIDYVLRSLIISKGYSLIHYGKVTKKDFMKQIKSSKNEDDLFYIVFDSDFNSPSNYQQAAQEIRENTREYIRLARSKNKNIKILLSGRAFETFLCMYKRKNGYTSPYFDMKQLKGDVLISKPDENYTKSEDWYIDYADRMHIDNISKMISKIKKSRLQVFTDNSSPINNHNNPNYFRDIEVNFLAKTAPYTYFDLLLEDFI